MRFYLILSLLTTILLFFIGCHNAPSSSLKISVNTQKLQTPYTIVKNGDVKSTIVYSNFYPLQIGIQIADDKGKPIYNNVLDTNVLVRIPLGNVTVTISYLAIGLLPGQNLVPLQTLAAGQTIPNNFCSTSQANSPFISNVTMSNGNSHFFYAETSQNFLITTDTSNLALAFNDPFTVVNQEKYGFIFLNSDGSEANQSYINFEDVISKRKINNPCTGLPFKETADKYGRIWAKLPVYNSSRTYQIVNTTTDGISKNFVATLDPNTKTTPNEILTTAANIPGFYKFYRDTKPSVKVMDPEDNFILPSEATSNGDGPSLASIRSRINVNRNPLYPDIINYTSTLTPTSISENDRTYKSYIFDNLTPLITLFKEQSSYSAGSEYSNRNFTVYCGIDSLNTSTCASTISVPYTMCSGTYRDIYKAYDSFRLPNPSLSHLPFNLKTYILDDDGFLATNYSSSYPYIYFDPEENVPCDASVPAFQ